MIPSFLTQLHFLRPWWFLAFIPLAYAWLLLRKQWQAGHQWERVCDPHLLPYLLQQSAGSSLKAISALIASGWIIAVIALAGPTWQKLPQPMYSQQQARVIVMDLSDNVRAADLQPSRLVRARYKLLDILRDMQEGQTGLIAYSGEPYLVSPLTEDTHTMMGLVPTLSPAIMPVAGNDLTAALHMAAKLIKQAGLTQGHIIVLAASSPSTEAISTAKTLAAEGITVSVLGIGTNHNAPMTLPDGQYATDDKGAIIFSHLNMDNLQELADAGHGRYVAFTDDDHDVKLLLNDEPVAVDDYTVSQSIPLLPEDANIQDKRFDSRSSLGQAKPGLDGYQRGAMLAPLWTPHRILKYDGYKATTQLWQDAGYWLVWLILIPAAVAFRRGWFGGRA